MLGDLHSVFAWVVVVANGVAGLWALGAHWRPGLRMRALWWFTAAAEVLIFVQVALGVALLNTEDTEVEDFHMFYGFVALVTVGIVYAYRDQLRDRVYLLYGGGGLFLMGLALRAAFIDATG